MNKLLLVIPVCLFLLFACGLPCRDNPIHPAFIGFTSEETDSIILRAYTPNDNYQHLVDTIIVGNKGATIFTTTNDTTIVYVNDSDPAHWIRPGFDWEIYLPGANRTFLVSGIVSEKTEGHKKCLNPVISFAVDNQPVLAELINSNQFFNSGYVAYLRK